MIIEVTKHNHDGAECFGIEAFGVIGLQSTLEEFEGWCLRAFKLGFEPVGGLNFEGECANFRCRRLAFRLKYFHVNQAFIDAVEAFRMDWNALPE